MLYDSSMRLSRVTKAAFLTLALTFGGFTVAAPPIVASQPAAEHSTAHFEVRFMKNMIAHHHMAVEMSELCLQKATRQELRELCNQIIADQNREIQTMQSWLRDWYGISYTPQMMPDDQRKMQLMANLSSTHFEIVFMQEMIKHHRTAIKEARTCTQRAGHEELTSLCNNIITAQRQEIAQMRQWLCQWYAMCKRKDSDDSHEH